MISIALIGAGARGKVLADYAATHPDAYLSDVVDIDAERSRRFCRMFHPNASAVPLEQLPHLNVDAWIIATPDASHYHYARLGLERNVHLLCEKPVGVSLRELDCLDDAVEKCSNDRVLMSAFVLRHHRFYRRLAEVVRELGMIRHVSVHDLLWGSYMYRRWHRSRSATGGPVAHEGVHSLDQLATMGLANLTCEIASAERLWFVPRLGVGPSCSYCAISHDCTEYFDARSDPLRYLYETSRMQEGYVRDLCVFNTMADVEDLVTARLQSNTGAVVNYSLCLFSPHQSRRFTFIGTDGTVVADEASGDLIVSSKQRHRHVIEVPREAGLYGGSDQAMFGRFIQRIMLGQTGREDFRQALQSSRTALDIEARLVRLGCSDLTPPEYRFYEGLTMRVDKIPFVHPLIVEDSANITFTAIAHDAYNTTRCGIVSNALSYRPNHRPRTPTDQKPVTAGHDATCCECLDIGNSYAIVDDA